MKKISSSIIWKLNNNSFTREYLMIPVIYIRDRLIDLKNYSFISKGKKGIKKYKGIHSGERCFIIGNGPSLKAEDLNMIKNEYSFAANRIYDIYPKTDWRPTYYGIQDYYVLKEITDEVEHEENGAKKRFIVSNRPECICKSMAEDKKNEFFYIGSCLSEKRDIKFSKDFSRIVGHGGTITYAMIQLAVYMGFSQIYLIGVDHNYSNFVTADGKYDSQAHASSHFDGVRPYKKLKINSVTPKNGITYIPTKAYEKAERMSATMGFKIYNATRGGKLEVFERIDLEDIQGLS